MNLDEITYLSLLASCFVMVGQFIPGVAYVKSPLIHT